MARTHHPRMERLEGGQRIAKHGMDVKFLSITLILLAFGLTMVFSASMPTALYSKAYHYDKFAIFRNQMIWAALGIVAMFFMANFDYHLLKPWVNIAFYISLGLMALVPLIGVTRGGATRWLGVGGFTIQPSEITKLTLILFFAKKLSEDKKNQIQNFRQGYIRYVFWIGVICLLCILQDHLSAAIIITAIAVCLIVAGGAKWQHLILTGVFGGAAFAALAIFEPYRMKRLLAFVDPFSDPQGIGYQIVQSLYAIGSGGIFGLGLGQSRQKYLYLPEAYNDYIFSIICEELGLIGAILVLVLFAIFVFRGMKIAVNAPDRFGTFIAFGVTMMVGLQTVINVGVVTSLLPSTGMQLPFFSAGGSSLVFLMASVGVMLNVSKQTVREPKDHVELKLWKRGKV